MDLWNHWLKRIDLFIANSSLQGMPAAHLAGIFMEQKPDLKVLIATATPSADVFAVEKTNRNVRLIEKPYLMQSLVETVDAFFGGRKKPWHQ